MLEFGDGPECHTARVVRTRVEVKVGLHWMLGFAVRATEDPERKQTDLGDTPLTVSPRLGRSRSEKHDEGDTWVSESPHISHRGWELPIMLTKPLDRFVQESCEWAEFRIILPDHSQGLSQITPK